MSTLITTPSFGATLCQFCPVGWYISSLNPELEPLGGLVKNRPNLSPHHPHQALASLRLHSLLSGEACMSDRAGVKWDYKRQEGRVMKGRQAQNKTRQHKAGVDSECAAISLCMQASSF